MPVMDGYESSKIIRQLLEAHHVRFNIVAITGHTEPQYAQKARDHGINTVIGKPITALQLATVLAEN